MLWGVAMPVHVLDHGDFARSEDTIGDRAERCADIERQAELGGHSVVRLLLKIHRGNGGPEGASRMLVAVQVAETEQHAASAMSLIPDGPNDTG